MAAKKKLRPKKVTKKTPPRRRAPGRQPAKDNGGSVASFTLEIEDEQLACWMTTNNTFTKEHKDHNPGDWFFRGVLIQLGDYVKHGSPGQVVKTHKFIGFHKGSSAEPEARLTSYDFQNDQIWVDVRPRSASRPAPMTTQHFDRAFPHEGGVPWKFHRYFTPYPKPGGITLWANDGGFDIHCAVDPRTKTAGHVFTFNGGQYDVRIYRNGKDKTPTALKGVDRIRIHSGGVDKPEGEPMNPPQRPTGP